PKLIFLQHGLEKGEPEAREQVRGALGHSFSPPSWTHVSPRIKHSRKRKPKDKEIAGLSQGQIKSEGPEKGRE
ncbi:unnamed protein product, partial [Rangifer tarandus platyrhynchus]